MKKIFGLTGIFAVACSGLAGVSAFGAEVDALTVDSPREQIESAIGRELSDTYWVVDLSEVSGEVSYVAPQGEALDLVGLQNGAMVDYFDSWGVNYGVEYGAMTFDQDYDANWEKLDSPIEAGTLSVSGNEFQVCSTDEGALRGMVLRTQEMPVAESFDIVFVNKPVDCAEVSTSISKPVVENEFLTDFGAKAEFAKRIGLDIPEFVDTWRSGTYLVLDSVEMTENPTLSTIQTPEWKYLAHGTTSSGEFYGWNIDLGQWVKYWDFATQMPNPPADYVMPRESFTDEQWAFYNSGEYVPGADGGYGAGGAWFSVGEDVINEYGECPFDMTLAEYRCTGTEGDSSDPYKGEDVEIDPTPTTPELEIETGGEVIIEGESTPEFEIENQGDVVIEGTTPTTPEYEIDDQGGITIEGEEKPDFDVHSDEKDANPVVEEEEDSTTAESDSTNEEEVIIDGDSTNEEEVIIDGESTNEEEVIGKKENTGSTAVVEVEKTAPVIEETDSTVETLEQTGATVGALAGIGLASLIGGAGVLGLKRRIN